MGGEEELIRNLNFKTGEGEGDLLETWNSKFGGGGVGLIRNLNFKTGKKGDLLETWISKQGEGKGPYQKLELQNRGEGAYEKPEFQNRGKGRLIKNLNFLKGERALQLKGGAYKVFVVHKVQIVINHKQRSVLRTNEIVF